MIDPHDSADEQNLVDALAKQIDAHLPRTRACRAWPNVTPRSQQTIFNGSAYAHQFHTGQLTQNQGGAPTAPDPALMRQVVTELLAQLADVELSAQVRNQVRSAAQQALDETAHNQPRQSRLRRLRDRLADLLNTGVSAGAGQGVQTLAGLVQRLF